MLELTTSCYIIPLRIDPTTYVPESGHFMRLIVTNPCCFFLAIKRDQQCQKYFTVVNFRLENIFDVGDRFTKGR
jgi:hypothetical protein